MFVSATLRHQLRDGLGPRLDAVCKFLGSCLKGSGWQRRRDRLGYVGSINSPEVTWGPVNGWHPHAHALLLFARPLTAGEVANLEDWLYGRWALVAERQGFGSIDRRYGVDVRPVTTAGDLAGYMTKVEGGWGAGHELARADLKAGRRDGNLAAVDLLRSFAETGDLAMLRLWREYEQATYGKRAVYWSAGLRARLLPDVEEVSDAEAATSEGVDVALLRTFIPADQWRAVVRAGAVGELLTEIEREAAALLLLCGLCGIELPPLGPWMEGGQRGQPAA